MRPPGDISVIRFIGSLVDLDSIADFPPMISEPGLRPFAIEFLWFCAVSMQTEMLSLIF